MESVFLLPAELVEAFGASLRIAATSEDFGPKAQVIGWIAGAIGIALIVLRALWRWITRVDARTHEDLRAAKRTCTEAQTLLKDAENRIDELRRFDPEVFLTDSRTAANEGVPGKPAKLGAAYLDPLRPALARAYADLGREALIGAGDRAELEEARRLVQGAFAADAQSADVIDLLSAIDEAAAAQATGEMSEEEKEAWRLSRRDGNPVAMVKTGQAMLKRGKCRIAHILLDRGWTLLRQQAGPEDRNTLWAKHAFAQCLGYQGKAVEALKLLEEVWAVQRQDDVLGEKHRDTLTTRHSIAQQTGALGHHKQALDIFEEVWAVQRRDDVLGEEHPDTLTTRSNIAHQTGALGRHKEALEIFEEVWAVLRRPDVLGEKHPYTLTTRSNIAHQTGALCHHREALEIFEEVWAVQRRADVLGEEHPDTLTTRAHVAHQSGALGRHKEALAIFEEVWAVLRRADVLGAEHPDTLATRAHLLFQKGLHGRATEVLPDFEANWAREKAPDVLGLEHPKPLQRRYQVARLRDLAGDRAGAGAALDGLRAAMLARFAPTHLWIRELDEWLRIRDAGAPPEPAG